MGGKLDTSDLQVHHVGQRAVHHVICEDCASVYVNPLLPQGSAEHNAAGPCRVLKAVRHTLRLLLQGPLLCCPVP